MESAEIAQVRGIWELVKPQKVHHGVETLIKMFAQFPETKERFSRFNCNSPDEMRTNVRMKAHAGRVVSQLGALIDDLDDMPLVDETIYLLGENHNKRKIQGDDFEKFTTVFMVYLKETLGDTFTPEASAAVGKFMGIFNKKMAANLDQ